MAVRSGSFDKAGVFTRQLSLRPVGVDFPVRCAVGATSHVMAIGQALQQTPDSERATRSTCTDRSSQLERQRWCAALPVALQRSNRLLCVEQ